MSNFPSNFDDDVTLPFVNNNLTEIGADAINATRDAIFQIEQEIGLGASGTAGSVAQRLGISILPDGSIKSSALTSLGLVTLPITNAQIENNAGIPESKLTLDYKSSDLYNYISNTALSANNALGWISVSGVKLDPHVAGALYKHELSHINVSSNVANYFTNKYRTYRNNTNSFLALNELNSELLFHQFADGYNLLNSSVITNNGTSMSANYAHPASGIFLNTSRFTAVPRTADDMQQFAQFINDSSSILNGTRNQNLFANGISKVSRSASLSSQIDGQSFIPSTPVVAYLLNTNTSSSPVDSIDNGDDIIEFKPVDDATFTFDSQFSLIKPGDIIHVNYGGYGGSGSVEVAFVIKEKKFILGGPSKYIIRIAGKNLFYSPSTHATARITKSLVNSNKYGVLAVGAANHNMAVTIMPSLIIGSPRNAMALGLGFNPDLFDNTHYLLYLALYPTGHPQDGYTILPAIDVTGNAGATPGLYTLDSIVEAINNKFRQPGFNYRFLAFSYQGEIGIMMSDCYNNAAFSILNAVITGSGAYDALATSLNFPNNVVGTIPTSSLIPNDPLGFGAYGSNIASPPYMSTYGSTESAQLPTKLFIPVTKANYYVDGTEKDKLSLEEFQLQDGYGDGYWLATITNRNPIPGISGRVETTYRVQNVNLCSTSIKEGKTIVIQSAGAGSFVDFGRFTIKEISLGCGISTYTDITVYDAVHANGISPASSSDTGTEVAIYFNSDSVSFNKESATDNTDIITSFKRHFEVYIDQSTQTFTHERGRINTKGSDISVNGVTLRSTTELSKLDLIRISPKLRGYQNGSVTKISLKINNYSLTGDFDGYLCSYDGSNCTKLGSTIYGRKGEITRLYDETNIDYIDVLFDVNTSVSAITNEIIDVQLFPSLSLDDELMMLATCQHNTSANVITRIIDERQFGNISEKELSTSALNFISLSDKLLHQNGIVRGFDLQTVLTGTNPSSNQIYIKGGVALVGGKFIYKNNETVAIPKIREYYTPNMYHITWALCINDKGEYQPIPLLDNTTILGSPNVDRVFTAYNPANTQKYNLDAAYFADIIHNRKDLTILYMVYSLVSGTGSSVTSTLYVSDVRKYVNDIEDSLPLKYDYGTSSGNFKNVSALFNWLEFNNKFNGTVIIKGANDIPNGTTVSNTASTSIRIISNGDGIITIDGNNESSLNFTGFVTIGKNIKFKNINLRFTDEITFDTADSLTFEHCNITVAQTSAPTDNIVFNFVNTDNILFDHCNITITYPEQISGGAAFSLTHVNKFDFINSIITTNFNVVPSTYYPGDVFIVNDSTNITFKNSNMSGNFIRAINIDASEHILVDNCIIQSTYDPQYDTSIYTAGDFVNSNYAYIQSTIPVLVDDVKVLNTKFYYNSSVASSHRFGFISFVLSTNTSVLNDVIIDGCSFNNLNYDTTVEDVRSAVAIINGVNATLISSSIQPIMSNVRITNNKCNRSQSIITTSKLNTSQMKYPGLHAVNCIISNNVCGTIGYFISSGTKYVNSPPTYNPNNYNSQYSDLVIENNTCYYVACVDSTGMYFTPSYNSSGTSYNRCDYSTGSVIIRNNKTSWVHVATTRDDNSKLSILDNHLSAYVESYISQFGEDFNYGGGNIGDNFGSGYAIYVSTLKHTETSVTNPTENNDSNCVISGNIIGAGYWYVVPSVETIYYYRLGGIYNRVSATIISNIIKGVKLTAGYPNVVLIRNGGVNSIITNNKLYRQGNNIYKYISFYSFEVSPAWDGVNSTCIVTDNYFDSPLTSDAGIDDILVTYPDNAQWIVERNINQTVQINLRPESSIQKIYGMYNWNNDPTKIVSVVNSVDESSLVVSVGAASSNITYNILYELGNLIPAKTKLTDVLLATELNSVPVLDSITARLTLENRKDYIAAPATPVTSLIHTYTYNGEQWNLVWSEKAGHFSNFINYSKGYLRLQCDLTVHPATAGSDTIITLGFAVKYRW